MHPVDDGRCGDDGLRDGGDRADDGLAVARLLALLRQRRTAPRGHAPPTLTARSTSVLPAGRLSTGGRYAEPTHRRGCAQICLPASDGIIAAGAWRALRAADRRPTTDRGETDERYSDNGPADSGRSRSLQASRNGRSTGHGGDAAQADGAGPALKSSAWRTTTVAAPSRPPSSGTVPIQPATTVRQPAGRRSPTGC